MIDLNLFYFVRCFFKCNSKFEDYGDLVNIEIKRVKFFVAQDMRHTRRHAIYFFVFSAIIK